MNNTRVSYLRYLLLDHSLLLSQRLSAHPTPPYPTPPHLTPPTQHQCSFLTLQLLIRESYPHLISPYSISVASHLQVMRI